MSDDWRAERGDLTATAPEAKARKRDSRVRRKMSSDEERVREEYGDEGNNDGARARRAG